MTITQTRRPAKTTSLPKAVPLGGAQDTQQATKTTKPSMCSPAGADSRPATNFPVPIGQAPGGDQPADRQEFHGTHGMLAVGFNAVPDQTAVDATIPKVSALSDPALALAADVLDDIEKVRTANANRLRILTRDTADSDGHYRGFGLDESHPDVARLAQIVSSLQEIEKAAEKQLVQQLRTHPLRAWVKSMKGIGEKQAARLLAAIGDPYIRPEIVKPDGTVIPEGPRTVSALWAYCGLHVLPATDHDNAENHGSRVGGGAKDGGDPGQSPFDALRPRAGVAPKRRRGQKANWSTNAKTRAYLIAESCMKQIKKPCHAAAFEENWLAVHYDDCACSPYRVVYDHRRMHTARTRPDLSDGHSHKDALRVASKAILRDLWREAKRLHEATEDDDA